MIKLHDYTSENHVSKRFPRTIGVILSAIGIGLAKWQIYDPLHAAERHQDEVWISSKLVGIAVVLSAYGIALIIFGRKTNDCLKIDPKNIDLRKACYLIGTAILCLVVYIWIMTTLSAQGYH